MTLNYEQLMQRNLKGFRFAVLSDGMTMTSRSASVTERYVVTEDDGEHCTISCTDSVSTPKKWGKSFTAKKIAEWPITQWNEEIKAYENSILEL